MTRPTVDVVIPLFRPGDWLPVCLGSVMASDRVDVRVVLIDDTPGDPDVSAEVVGLPNVKLIRLPSNVGYARAVNLGIAEGAAPNVLLMNQDARIGADFLIRMCERLAADPLLASVSGKVLHQPGPHQKPDGTIDTVGIEFRRGRRAIDLGQGDRDDGRFDGWRDVFGVCAAVAMYRRSALESVAENGNVMDETFYMHKEDVDLAWRLRRAGYRAGVDGAAIAWHERGSRRAADSATGRIRPIQAMVALLKAERAKTRAVRRLAWRNQLRMLIKNESRRDLIRSLPGLVLHQAAYLAVGLLLDPVGTVTDRVRFMKEYPGLLERRRKARRTDVDLSHWLP